MPVTLSKSCQTCESFCRTTPSYGTCSRYYNLRVMPHLYCELYEPRTDQTWSKTWLQKHCGPDPRLKGWQQGLKRAIEHATDTKRSDIISQRTIIQAGLLLEWEKDHPAPKKWAPPRPGYTHAESPKWHRWYETRKQVERNFPLIPEDFTNTLRVYLKQFRAEYIKNNPPPALEPMPQQNSTTRFEEAISDD